MTDTEIAIRALAEWPDSALPPRVLLQDGPDIQARFLEAGGNKIPIDHAIALFVAAGIEYLLAKKNQIDLRQPYEKFDDYCVEWAHCGSTLFAAIDSAIRNQSAKEK